jgi:hypothetical protein
MSEQRAQSKPGSESAKAGTVNVCNMSTAMLSVALRSPKSTAINVEHIVVDLMPGNNTVDATLWEECKKAETVQHWLSNLVRLDRVGKPHKTKWLEEGVVDPDATSTTRDLGRRMEELTRAKRRAR